MLYMCAYSSVQLDKSHVEKEFTAAVQLSCKSSSKALRYGMCSKDLTVLPAHPAYI